MHPIRTFTSWPVVLVGMLFFPVVCQAQIVPATYAHNGTVATAAPFGIERDWPRQSGPRGDASGMNAPSTVENLPFVRLPNGARGPTTGPASLIRRVKPAFRLSESEMNFPDAQDMIFFGESRVVRVRLHLKVNGQPMSKHWLNQLRICFNFLDRDGDGMLNAFEADFVFSNNSIKQLLQTGQTYINPNEPGRLLVDFDRDDDGKISFDEFVAYYSRSAPLLFRSQPGTNRDQFSETLTDELFKLLDRDRDGKLSKAELADADKLLARFDQNEDECLTALEIVPNLFAQSRPPAQQAKTADRTLQFFAAGVVPDDFVEQLLAHYDKNKDLRLSREESGFDSMTFGKLDKNGDGQLSIAELLAWKDLPPDLELELSLVAQQDKSNVKVLPGPDGKPTPFAGAVTFSGQGKAIMHVGKQPVDIGVVGAPLVLPAPSASTLHILFDQADLKKKGYLTENDMVGPQFQYLRIVFDVADRDGDGRLTKQEYFDYLSLQYSFTNLPLTLTHLTQTPSLFAVLDANADGRLSVRELRNAQGRLKDLERAAIQARPVVRFVRTSQTNLASGAPNYNPVVQTPTKGPLWFRKMDRNGDGDVSRSEFPGRAEDFDKIDLDHDGLISLEEAEAAEKQYRQAKSDKN